jgi:hypothetical protein
VLDFIGQHRQDFRFDRILSAMTGLPRGALREALARGFPTLPSGCHLDLDRVARAQVLASLQRTLRGGTRRLAEELRVLVGSRGGIPTLAEFLRESGRDLEEVFTEAGWWSAIKRAAGLAVPAALPGEETLGRKLSQLLHIDEPERLTLYRRLFTDSAMPVDSDVAARHVMMLAYQMFHQRSELLTANTFLARLRAHPAICQDMGELFGVLADNVGLAVTAAPPGTEWPLAIHRRYARREILTAVGHWSEQRKPDSREGVVRLDEARTELFFVTLDKSGKRFSPTTSYEDYAISADLFHWQSQNTASAESETGRRYREQATNGWRFLLFVRPTVDVAYTYLGGVRFVSHLGSRPMSVTWRMEHRIPGTFLADYARLTA